MLRLAFAIRNGTTTTAPRREAVATAAATRSLGGSLASNHHHHHHHHQWDNITTHSCSRVPVRALSATATSNSLHDLDPITAQEFALLRRFVFPERIIVQIEAARATISSSSCSSLSNNERYQDGHFILDEMDMEWDVLADLTQDSISSKPEVVSAQWKAPTDF
jgi:hypothetical protein